MTILRDLGDSVLKYGESFINKAEQYTKIAKLKIEIKQTESKIEKFYIQAGMLATDEYQKGMPSFDLTQKEIKEIVSQIDSLNEIIQEKKNRIDDLKRSEENAASDNTPKGEA